MTVRGFLLIVSCLSVCGQPLDVGGQPLADAVHSLTAQIFAHLAVNETAHVTSRNLSSMGPGGANQVHAAVERALRKRVRNPMAVDVLLTISQNVRGYLLVAQIRQDIAMASFRMESPAARSKLAIDKKLMWEQEIPILDVAAMDDELLVLDTNGVTRYEHRTRVEAVAVAATVMRDPRGRMEIAGDALTVYAAGSVCRGTWKPLALACENTGQARNTLESEGWPPYFSLAQIGPEYYLAQVDGRTHIYGADHKESGSIEEWGGDFAAACGGTRILAAGAGDRDSRDFVALYEVPNRAPARVSDPLEFSGPVMALADGRAVIRNLSTGRYEAYSLTMDCGR